MLVIICLFIIYFFKKLIWKTKSGTNFTLFVASEKVVNAVMQGEC